MSEKEQIEEYSEDEILARRAQDDKRKRLARMFAIVCLIGAAWWGSKVFQRAYPHDVVLQYTYRDVPSPHTLSKVHISLFAPDQKAPHAMITYYHQGGLTNARKTKRRQTLKLPKGSYPLYITLYYKNGSTKKRRHNLQIRDSGTYYIPLKGAQ